MKVFFVRPVEVRPLLGRLLHNALSSDWACSSSSSSCPSLSASASCAASSSPSSGGVPADLRDRALFFYRLLRTDAAETRRIFQRKSPSDCELQRRRRQREERRRRTQPAGGEEKDRVQPPPALAHADLLGDRGSQEGTSNHEHDQEDDTEDEEELLNSQEEYTNTKFDSINDVYDPTVAARLLNEFNTLAVVYRQPSTQVMQGPAIPFNGIYVTCSKRRRYAAIDEDLDDADDDEEEDDDDPPSTAPAQANPTALPSLSKPTAHSEPKACADLLDSSPPCTSAESSSSASSFPVPSTHPSSSSSSSSSFSSSPFSSSSSSSSSSSFLGSVSLPRSGASLAPLAAALTADAFQAAWESTPTAAARQVPTPPDWEIPTAAQVEARAAARHLATMASGEVLIDQRQAIKIFLYGRTHRRSLLLIELLIGLDDRRVDATIKVTPSGVGQENAQDAAVATQAIVATLSG
eukprot:GHVT01002099.1.p1 GENE.GHVT01002099.1~~GHVT01002099.1.p1  ORF type:complete len:465 (+),score=175.88 GHVT01002099.1:313-1707(+)